MQNGGMYDWNDIRCFLAVARSGSTLGAAKELAVNQTTAARRIEALEQALGLKLFERGHTGSRMTDAAKALLPRRRWSVRREPSATRSPRTSAG
jgi:DNA-binding transcriptional LysR family regulator